MEKLAVYVHWPYCARICPYCDFNVYKGAKDSALVKAIIKDLLHWRSLTGPREIISIHFGGGTPSLMQPVDIRAVIDCVDELWGLPKNVEIGLEANPQDQDEVNWRAFSKAGINRLSLGVQSFHDPALKFLGRDHTGESAKTALALARSVFDNISLDLIFGWADQTDDLLHQDLETALSFQPEHISTYQLTIERGTAFERSERRGKLMAVKSDQSADFYDEITQSLQDHGYDHYEVSNFAKNGYQSRHNLSYWRGLDYVGVGPGAHGRLTKDGQRRATIAHMRPEDYVKAVGQHASGIMENEILTPQDWGSEFLLMGLRINEGIAISSYEKIASQTLNLKTIEELKAAGYLEHSDDLIKATPSGRKLLNKITELLLT